MAVTKTDVVVPIALRMAAAVFLDSEGVIAKDRMKLRVSLPPFIQFAATVLPLH